MRRLTLRGASTVDVLDGRLVAKRNLIPCQAKDFGDRIAILRARSPTAKKNRDNALLVEAGALGKLLRVDLVIDTKLLDGFGGISHVISRASNSQVGPASRAEPGGSREAAAASSRQNRGPPPLGGPTAAGPKSSLRTP